MFSIATEIDIPSVYFLPLQYEPTSREDVNRIAESEFYNEKHEFFVGKLLLLLDLLII
jgi:hypothetical protein